MRPSTSGRRRRRDALAIAREGDEDLGLLRVGVGPVGGDDHALAVPLRAAHAEDDRFVGRVARALEAELVIDFVSTFRREGSLP